MDHVLSNLNGLFQDPDGVKRVLEALLEAAMEQEVEGHVGAGYHERSPDRRGRRNGYKPRRMKTRVGELDLSVPQVRGCEPYHPSMFARFQRSERALLVACAEMYYQGVSTRNVRRVLDSMCGGEISSATVSRVAAELDERLGAFRSRRLKGMSYPYLQVDARYEKVRVEKRVVSQAVLTVMGYNALGAREILDWRVDDSESEDTWSAVFRSLKGRGLTGVELVVSDAHAGIRAALDRHFQGAAWQRCRVHFKREMMMKVSHRKRKDLMDDLRAVFAGEDERECLLRGEEMAERWDRTAPKASAMIREGLQDCLAVLQFPEEHRIRLTSTNLLENLMRRLKKRSAVVGVFPNRSSCDRLLGAQLIEVHEDWQTNPRGNMNMELRKEVDQSPRTAAA
jgi:putative transposase